MNSNPRKALIVAGGTGGHIFPGLSVADELKARGWVVEWAGNPAAMEGRLVPTHGLVLNPLVFAGFRGKGLIDQLLMPFRLMKACCSAWKTLRAMRPNVVLGLGGYVAFPVGVVTKLLNIPLVVHEQNSVAGLTNRILSKLANRTLVAFPEALPNAEWVGNPVRSAVVQQASPVERFAHREGPLKLLVLGGSLGAQALNEVVPKALALLPAESRPEVTHQAGEKNLGQLIQNYQTAGVEASTVAFIDDVASAMAQADLVICRSGAMTVAEVAAIGVAALFVPFPYAVDDHQTTNAAFLVADQAAWMKQQFALTPEGLAQWLKTIDRHACVEVATRALNKAKPQATADVVKHIEQVA
jgi:UDP-N-acetylglucosamine--N-acetylmuramyl-(pentapeptide) pyrophosphoryl-undecaprenol N-acetylglucosamine transferase